MADGAVEQFERVTAQAFEVAPGNPGDARVTLQCEACRVAWRGRFGTMVAGQRFSAWVALHAAHRWSLKLSSPDEEERDEW